MANGVTETFTKIVTIGEHTAIMRLDGDRAFTCDWTPNFPRRLTASELETYWAARAALVALAKKSRYDALVYSAPAVLAERPRPMVSAMIKRDDGDVSHEHCRGAPQSAAPRLGHWSLIGFRTVPANIFARLRARRFGKMWRNCHIGGEFLSRRFYRPWLW